MSVFTNDKNSYEKYVQAQYQDHVRRMLQTWHDELRDVMAQVLSGIASASDVAAIVAWIFSELPDLRRRVEIAWG